MGANSSGTLLDHSRTLPGHCFCTVSKMLDNTHTQTYETPYTAAQLLLSRQHEFAQPIYMMKLDIYNFVDSIKCKLVHSSLIKRGVPASLAAWLVRETLCTMLELKLPGGVGDAIRIVQSRCVWQGAQSSPSMSTAVLADIVTPLHRKWCDKGYLVALSLSAETVVTMLWFADDGWLVSQSVEALQDMPSNLNEAFHEADLGIQFDKCSWLGSGDNAGERLLVGGLEVPRVSVDQGVRMLGALLTFGSCSKQAVRHRMRCTLCAFNQKLKIFTLQLSLMVG